MFGVVSPVVGNVFPTLAKMAGNVVIEVRLVLVVTNGANLAVYVCVIDENSSREKMSGCTTSVHTWYWKKNKNKKKARVQLCTTLVRVRLSNVRDVVGTCTCMCQTLYKLQVLGTFTFTDHNFFFSF